MLDVIMLVWWQSVHIPSTSTLASPSGKAGRFCACAASGTIASAVAVINCANILDANEIDIANPFGCIGSKRVGSKCMGSKCMGL